LSTGSVRAHRWRGTCRRRRTWGHGCLRWGFLGAWRPENAAANGPISSGP